MPNVTIDDLKTRPPTIRWELSSLVRIVHQGGPFPPEREDLMRRVGKLLATLKDTPTAKEQARYAQALVSFDPSRAAQLAVCGLDRDQILGTDGEERTVPRRCNCMAYCPRCTRRNSRKQARDREQKLVAWASRGCQIYSATLTPPKALGLSAREAKDRFLEKLQPMLSALVADGAKPGLAPNVYAGIDVSVDSAGALHVHAHLIFPALERSLAKVRATLLANWRRVCPGASEEGFSIRLVASPDRDESYAVRLKTRDALGYALKRHVSLPKEVTPEAADAWFHAIEDLKGNGHLVRYRSAPSAVKTAFWDTLGQASTDIDLDDDECVVDDEVASVPGPGTDGPPDGKRSKIGRVDLLVTNVHRRGRRLTSSNGCWHSDHPLSPTARSLQRSPCSEMSFFALVRAAVAAEPADGVWERLHKVVSLIEWEFSKLGWMT